MRRNLRLDWRALALLGALLSLIINWPGSVIAMPALVMSNRTNNISNNSNYNNNSNINNNNYNNDNNNSKVNVNLNISNLNIYNIQSDHSHNSVQSDDHSLNQNQSISAEFNMRTFIQQQQTAIATTTELPTTTSTAKKVTSQTTITTTIKNNAEHDDDDSEENVKDKETQFQGFVFLSSPRDHMAILSRTERSIRHQQEQHHQHHHHHHQRQQQQSEQQSLAGSAVGAPAAAVGDNKFIGSKSKRLNNSSNNHLNINSSSNHNNQINHSNLDRNERSTMAYMAGPSRKIQLYIKNRFIQLLPDGTVNGTEDESSEYIILQRSSIDVGRITIQSVATCLYLCMDACGSVYGSKDYNDDCVFNENMEEHNYNTYSSTYNSNSRHILFLGLNRYGQPRKIQISPNRTLSNLTKYANAIAEMVPEERVEKLIAKNFGSNRVKHGVRQLCDTGKPIIPLIDAEHFKARPQCNNPNRNSNSNSNSNSRMISSSHRSSNVSAANDRDKAKSISPSDNREVGSSQQFRSIINSQSHNESGHISSNSSSNPTSVRQQHNNHPKKKGKKRKCRPHENEDEHNCVRRPVPLRKRDHISKKRCKELHDQSKALGQPPPNCDPKRASKRPGSAGSGKAAMNKPKGSRQQGNKSAVAGEEAPAGKKKQPKMSGKQRSNTGGKKRGGGSGPRNVAAAGGVGARVGGVAGAGGAGGGGSGVAASKRSRLKQKKLAEASTTSTSTIASSLVTPESSWESSSPLPALSLSETSDRVERNVRGFREQHQQAHANNDDADMDDEDADADSDSAEDNSYEDGASQQTAAGGADDSLYYDQFDSVRLLLLPLLVMLWLHCNTPM